MRKSEARDKILEAAWELLQEKRNPEAVTVRDVAAKAGVGMGLINYHFASKDKMLMEAAGEVMKKAAEAWQGIETNDEIKNPKHMNNSLERLYEMLTQLADMGSEYMYLTQMGARFELLEGKVETPLVILPYIKWLTGLDDTDSKLIAFSLITATQSAVLRPKALKAYSGYDIENKNDRDEFIKKLIETCLGNYKKKGD